ncbi:MAG: TrmB family transcriptional regulator [Candidatus Aenigmatarchaeota archaeon]
MDQSLINDLSKFGLNQYEAKTYLVLTKYGSLTAYKISNLTGIPQSKIYEVVRSLVTKSLIEISSAKPRKYRAVEPVIALKKIINQKKKYISDLQSKANSILKELKPSKTKGGIWLSKGKRAFLEKSTEMAKRTKKYAYALTKEFSRIPMLDNEVIKIRKRGIKVKMLGIKKFINEIALARAKWYASQGIEVRMTPLEIQPRICLVDGKEVCIRIDEPSESDFIWSDNPAFINVMKSYFENLWKDAEKFKF